MPVRMCPSSGSHVVVASIQGIRPEHLPVEVATTTHTTPPISGGRALYAKLPHSTQVKLYTVSLLRL